MRLPRLQAPGIPLHITQRGVNRQAVFVDDRDRHLYLALLARAAARHDAQVHGYVLMDNHVHLIASSRREDGLSRMMQATTSRYVRRLNQRWGRTGTLWEGRFHSSVVDNDRYLLACLAYVELNPVRAGIVARAEDHRWSSARHHLGHAEDAVVESHDTWRALGPDDARHRAWQAVLGRDYLPDHWEHLRERLYHERAVGGPGFTRILLTHPVGDKP